MLNLSISFDAIGYDSVIDVLFPLIFKNKLTIGASKTVAKAMLKNKTQSEKDAYVATFINEHKDKILNQLQSEADSQGIILKISGVTASKE